MGNENGQERFRKHYERTQPGLDRAKVAKIDKLVAKVADAPSGGSATLFALSAAAGTCCLVKPDNPVITSVEASGNWAVGFFAFAALVAFYAAAKYLLADDARGVLSKTYKLTDEDIDSRVERYKAKQNEDSCFGSGLDISGGFR